MPYIPKEQRDAVPAVGPRNGAELAYLLTTEVSMFLNTGTEINYDKMTAARGALQSALQELEDRIIRPYEDRKIRENGDVFSSDLLHFVQNG